MSEDRENRSHAVERTDAQILAHPDDVYLPQAIARGSVTTGAVLRMDLHDSPTTD